MSSRRGISCTALRQLQEPIEQIARVVGARAGLGVVLDRAPGTSRSTSPSTVRS